MFDVPLPAHMVREAARARRSRRLSAAGLMLVLVGIAAVPAYEIARTWAADRAERRQWNVEGPPCPMVERPSRSATGRRPARTFRYGDVAFTRSFGGVSCAAFREGEVWAERVYRVCQFNNPGAVTVATSRGVATFEAAPGRRVTVTVRDGRASCVVGGWFRL